MKKFDFLVITIVLLLSISFYVIYFNNIRLTEDMIVEIRYKNMIVYQAELEESINIEVEITSKNNVLTVKAGNIEKIYQIKSNDEIENTIKITYNEIRMIYANCDNKLCYHMKLNRVMPTPIVCTNGIMVRINTNEFVIEV